jgi:hypothetical protein
VKLVESASRFSVKCESAFPPFATNVATLPEHADVGVCAIVITEGKGLTVKITVPAVAAQPFASVPEIVYVVVMFGLAETEAVFVADKPVEGDHE